MVSKGSPIYKFEKAIGTVASFFSDFSIFLHRESMPTPRFARLVPSGEYEVLSRVRVAL